MKTRPRIPYLDSRLRDFNDIPEPMKPPGLRLATLLIVIAAAIVITITAILITFALASIDPASLPSSQYLTHSSTP